MSRSGYSEECNGWALIRWRGAVNASIKGRRGQQFLKDLLAALDAMPEKRLLAGLFQDTESGGVCAIAALGKQRGLDMTEWDPEYPDHEEISTVFNIAPALMREIEFENDEHWGTPESRWVHMRKWVVAQLKVTP